MIKETIEEETYVGFFCGSFSSLVDLDFSELNLKFVQIDSKEFNSFMSKVSDSSLISKKVLDEFKKYKTKHSILHALIPIDEIQPVIELDLYKVRNLLLLLFPSDIFVEYLMSFRIEKSGLDFVMYDKFKQLKIDPSKPYGNFVFIERDLIDNINKFIKLFFQRYEQISYLIPAYKSYVTSYFQNFKSMEYLNLCISLETIVEAKTELTYRIKRNIAVLLSPDVDFGKRIFKNIGYIYNLRSSIAHSGKYSEEKIEEYLPYLRSLVSVLIIELIKHNNNSLTLLNEELTAKGYGDFYQTNDEFLDFELNTRIVGAVLYTELTK